MEQIESIEKFDIHRAANGYTISMEYRPAPEEKGHWIGTEFKTLIAKDLDEVRVLMEEWFGKLAD